MTAWARAPSPAAMASTSDRCRSLHPYVARVMARRSAWLARYDQSVIVLIVYTAFLKSVREGVWTQLPLQTLAIICCMLLLVVVLAIAMLAARRLGFSREDEIAAVFCGSKKSLASGLPLAQVLFGGATGLGLIVLYNQIQILAGAALARRYAELAEQSPGSPDGVIREL